MLKLYLLTKVFIRIHGLKFSFFLDLVQFLFLAFLNWQIQPSDIVVSGYQSPSYFLIGMSVCFIGIAHFFTYAYLGIIFNSVQRGSWFAQLPFSNAVKNVLPLTFITINGLAVLHFFPLGYFRAGASLYFVGLPLCIYFIFKYSRSEEVGLIKMVLYSLPILVLGYFSTGWFYLRPQLIGSLWMIAIMIPLLIVFSKNSRKFIPIPVGLVFLYLLISFTSNQIKTPKNFSEAVYFHSFYPTTKTFEDYKNFATNRVIWNSPEQFRLPGYINYVSVETANKLTDKEKIIFAENISQNHQSWSGASFPKLREHNFSLFPPFREMYSYITNNLPLNRKNMTKATEAYLYSHWKNQEVFCNLLPTRPNKAYLDKMFFESECRDRLRHTDVWKMYFKYGSDFKSLFKSYLLTPTKTPLLLSAPN